MTSPSADPEPSSRLRLPFRLSWDSGLLRAVRSTSEARRLQECSKRTGRQLDEQTGRVAADASGHGLDGRFSHEPKRVPGAAQKAVELDGRTDFVNVGHPSAFRVVGSMTVSAWIKSSRYPVDDAAIVSTHEVHDDAAGYQLDTTIDRGPRTVGFKLANECGELMARYGSTPLALDEWY